jgi:hypothetical protein
MIETHMNMTLVVIAFASVLLAIGASGIAWRIVREDRLRSDARVAALADDIHRVQSDRSSPVAVANLFGTGRAPERDAPMAVIAGVGILIAAAVGVVMFSGSFRRPLPPAKSGTSAAPAVSTAASRAPVVSPAVPAAPLELVALGHERVEDRLTVRGIIRNPADGSALPHLTAVVLVFNQQGGFLTSGRTTVETQALEPGAEAPFVVTVPGTADVGRYRVSFRTDDRVVPHIDRRS